MSLPIESFEPSVPARQQETPLTSHVDAIFSNRWMIIAIALLAFLGAVAYVMVTPKVFSADIIVQVEEEMPQGQSRTYMSATGKVYTWYGLLGLAPGWTSGNLPTVAEQQIITACLAAHTNKFGLNIKVSVLGRGATGVEIPYSASEVASYSENEACFFGNTFNNEGIFAANDRTFLKQSESTTRACGLSSKQSSTRR